MKKPTRDSSRPLLCLQELAECFCINLAFIVAGEFRVDGDPLRNRVGHPAVFESFSQFLEEDLIRTVPVLNVEVKVRRVVYAPVEEDFG